MTAVFLITARSAEQFVIDFWRVYHMIAVFLIGAAAVLLLHGFLYEKNWFRNLSVRVLFSRSHVFAGEVFELTEVIENRKKMALPIVEIGFRVPKGLHFEDAENTLESDFIYKRDLFAIRGMERIVRRYHVKAQRRGFYSVSQLSCHVPSRLFRRTYMMDRREQSDGSGLYVYPANVNCSMLLRAVEVILGERECARRLYEDPFVFSSIRPYTPQDPQKSVNWKATAKAGELMVNTYASSSALRVRIYLDVSADPGVLFSDSFRELGISMAASLIRSLVKAQRDASLVVNCTAGTAGTAEAAPDSPQTGLPSCVRFASCNSAQKLTAVEEFLTTDFDHASLCPFGEMLQRETGSSGKQAADSGSGLSASDEVFVFLSCADSPSLRAQIHALLGTQRSGVFAVPSRTADRRREEQERNLHILPVCNLS